MYLLINNLCFFLIVKSAKFNASGGALASQNTTDSDSSDDQSQPNQTQPNLVHAKYDLLVWFEVLELGNYHNLKNYLVNYELRLTLQQFIFVYLQPVVVNMCL